MMNDNERDQVSVRDVLMQFLRDERTRPKYRDQLADLDEWTRLNDQQFIDKVREFASSRDDTNPVLTWTIGTGKNKHHECVCHWEKTDIPISELYSCGINPQMKADLKAANWNIVKFAKESAHKYEEFKLDQTPNEGQRRIIVVRKSKDEHIGTHEIVDGAHRSVALAHQDVVVVPVYVGVLKDA